MAVVKLVEGKGHTREDRCTNALISLLQSCSPEIAYNLVSLIGLPITEVPQQVGWKVQMRFDSSIPDAVLEFPGPKYVVIEAKIHSGVCSEAQLLNHYHGAVVRFGEDNIYLVFLSVERTAPMVIRRLSARFPGKVFFLSWQQVLRFLGSLRTAGSHGQRFLLEQFFAIIRSERLWRLFSMNTDELKSFLTHFPEVSTGSGAATNTLQSLLDDMVVRAVARSAESVEDLTSEDSQADLPCLYSALKIRGWHTNSSAYIFVNVTLGKAGVILTGYQDDAAQKQKLLGRWQELFKSAYAADPHARTFIWVEVGEDEFAGSTGYFKLIEGTVGQVFDPSKFEVFADYFYWGYWRDLDVGDSSKLSELIAEDFNKLLATYAASSPTKTEKVRTKRGAEKRLKEKPAARKK